MGPGEGKVPPAATRAAVTFESLQRELYDPATGLYRKHRAAVVRGPEVFWPFTSAWAATCSLAGLPPAEGSTSTGEAERVLGGRLDAALRYARGGAARRVASDPVDLGSTVYRRVWSPISRQVWRAGTSYYDDNGWAALALLHQFRLGGPEECLDLARRIFGFITSGWSTETGWSHPGGIRWADARWSRSRNTCANGPAAEVGAELFLLTGADEHLEWATRTYAWTRETLCGVDGLYADQIRPDGRLDPKRWSYNQGSMIGAGVLLHQATGDETYLDQAVRTASSSLDDCAHPDRLLEEPAIFVAVYLRNLLMLDAVRPDARYRERAEAYASAMWSNRRDERSGLFLPVSSGVNGTAALVLVDAILAGSPPRP